MKNLNSTNLSRRSFLIKVSSVLALLSSVKVNAMTLMPNESNRSLITVQQWQLIGQIQNHLLPHEKNSPGASDINALEYLKSIYQVPTVDIKELNEFRQGIHHFQLLFQRKYQKQSFISLSIAEKEIFLRWFEKTRIGGAWLNILLDMVLEALLTDPIYGGNPNEIGWKWLQHQAGFPRPTKVSGI